MSRAGRGLAGQARTEYGPLSGFAVEQILRFDEDAGFGSQGERPNLTRFYIWLELCEEDVQIRTVAVKAPNGRKAGRDARWRDGSRPYVKEVVRASVDDSLLHVIDLACYSMGGYVVDWSWEFKDGKPLAWTYGRRWESAPYERRGMWKIVAPVINPEVLEESRRFRWAQWSPSSGHILDYLKVFAEHPEIELLSKKQMERFCTKMSMVRKLKADPEFRRFFVQHEDAIRCRHLGADVILKAYFCGLSIDEASGEINARRLFRGLDLPRCVNAKKALAFLHDAGVHRYDYAKYLNECVKAGLDLDDTKVCFPKNFAERVLVVKDLADAVRRRENAEAAAKLNERLAAVVSQWQRLEKKRGAFRVVLPRTEADFFAEGKAMSNCLCQYAGKVARGDVVVVFVRRKDAPESAFVAASYDPKSKQVLQCYGMKNSRPSKAVVDFVNKIFPLR
jgi:hypothetical protein